METLERLLVTIEGSSELLRQELKKGGVDVDKWARDAETRAGKVDNSFKKLGSTLRTTLASLGIGLSVGFLVNFTRGAIQAADAVGESAKQAGFGAERFQRLAFVYRQGGLEAGEFESAVRSANTRLGQFITDGTGPAAKAIEELGLKQRILNGEIRTGEQFYDAVVEALGKIDNAAKRSALSAAIFTREIGSKMAPVMERGAEAIEQAAAAATGIFTDDMVRKADALADASERFSTNFLKAAAVQGAFDLGLLFGVDEVVKVANSLEHQISELERRRAVAAGNERAGLGVVRSSASFDAEIASLKAQLAVQQEERRIQELSSRPFITTSPEAREAAFAKDPLQPITSRGRRMTAMDFRVEGMRQLQLGDTGLEEMAVGSGFRMPAGLRQMPNFQPMIQRTEEYAKAVDEARQRQERFADAIAASFESRGMDALLSGKPRDALRGFAQDLAELVIRMTVLQPLAEKLAGTLSNIGSSRGGGGKGRFANFLGNLFGFASGGRPSVGRAAWVGEKGPELWVPDVPGRIHSNAQSMKMAAAGGLIINQNFYTAAGLPPQWHAELTGVAHQAASAAYEAVTNRMGGRR